LLLLVEPLQDQQARGGQHDHGGQQGSFAHWQDCTPSPAG
jgi:hypothetical protein